MVSNSIDDSRGMKTCLMMDTYVTELFHNSLAYKNDFKVMDVKVNVFLRIRCEQIECAILFLALFYVLVP